MTRRTSLFLLAIAVLAILIPACSTSQHKVTPLELSLCTPTQLAGEDYTVDGLRLNLIHVENKDINGLDIGLGANECKDVAGVQVVGVGTVARTVHGVQAAALVAAAEGPVNGVQIAGLSAFGGVNGIQFSPILTLGGGNGVSCALLTCADVNGLQLGALNGSAADMACGAQIGLMGNVPAGPDGTGDHDYAGLQAGGIFNNRLGVLYGAQLAFACNRAFAIHGVQAALINSTGPRRQGTRHGSTRFSDLRGVQIGLINRAEQSHGVQIGLINLSKNGGLRFCPIVNCWFFSPPEVPAEPADRGKMERRRPAQPSEPAPPIPAPPVSPAN